MQACAADRHEVFDEKWASNPQNGWFGGMGGMNPLLLLNKEDGDARFGKSQHIYCNSVYQTCCAMHSADISCSTHTKSPILSPCAVSPITSYNKDKKEPTAPIRELQMEVPYAYSAFFDLASTSSCCPLKYFIFM